MAQIALGDTNHPFNSNLTENTEEQLCQLNALLGKDVRYSLETYQDVRDKLAVIEKSMSASAVQGKDAMQLYMVQLHIKVLDMQICGYETSPNFAAAITQTIFEYLPILQKRYPPIYNNLA